jgi:hypothetical protein
MAIVIVDHHLAVQPQATGVIEPVQHTVKIDVFEVVPGAKSKLPSLSTRTCGSLSKVGKVFTLQTRLPIGRGSHRAGYGSILKKEGAAGRERHLSAGKLLTNAVQRRGCS